MHLSIICCLYTYIKYAMFHHALQQIYKKVGNVIVFIICQTYYLVTPKCYFCISISYIFTLTPGSVHYLFSSEIWIVLNVLQSHSKDHTDLKMT